MHTGIFISFEGVEGCGKSTQSSRLVQRFRDTGREVVHVREPGGTPLGDRVRAILLDADEVGMDPRAEMLLFAASRAQLVRTVIRPAMERGAAVVCDRFLHSSLAYQGHARGLGRDRVLAANHHATDGLLPDRVILLQVPAARSLERALARSDADRFEQEALDFHEAVAAGFAAEAAEDPERFAVIDGTGTIEAVAAAVEAAVAAVAPELA